MRSQDGSSCDEERELSLFLVRSRLIGERERGREVGARCDAWDVKSSKRSPGISCGQRFLRGSVIEDGCETSPVSKTRMSLSPGRHPALPEGFAPEFSSSAASSYYSLVPTQRPFNSSAVGLRPRKMRLLRTMPAWVYPGMPTLSPQSHRPLHSPLLCHRATLHPRPRCISLSLVCALPRFPDNPKSPFENCPSNENSLSLSLLFALFNASPETGIGPPFSLVENLCSSSCSFDERERERGRGGERLEIRSAISEEVSAGKLVARL